MRFEQFSIFKIYCRLIQRLTRGLNDILIPIREDSDILCFAMPLPSLKNKTIPNDKKPITGPEWVANLIAIAALASSLYSVHVTRVIAKVQEQQDLEKRSMQFTIALRFDVPYHPRLSREMFCLCVRQTEHE
jgi:hypothetical protein